MDAHGLDDAASDVGSSVRRGAGRAGDSALLENGARLGYAVSGLLHLLIAWLGIQLAIQGSGGGGGSADQSGALQVLAGNTLGRALLWVAVVGFGLLAVWQLTELVGRHEAGDRLKAAAKAVLYAVLTWSSLQWARGSGGSSSSEQSVDVTARLMKEPAGRWLVGLVGLVVVGVGVYHVVKGWRRRFLDDLQSHPGRVAEVAGRYGYVAKGLALVLVGVLFVLAAWHASAQEARGLDGALRTLLQAPGGQVLLGLVSLGFAAYGVYSFARARHARV